MSVVMIVPASVTELHDQGVKYKPAADGTITIPEARLAAFEAMGCQRHPTIQSGLTTGRPTVGLFAGMPFFDTTLNKPIWRNKLNTGWVDATGTAV